MCNSNLYKSPNVANKIKQLAKSKKIQQKQILEDCNLGANTFSHMLHGKSIAFDSLAKIADYLDCSVDYLLGRTSEIKKTAATDEPAQQLLNEFYELNQNGRDKLLEEAIMMNRSGMYKIAKNSEFSAG